MPYNKVCTVCEKAFVARIPHKERCSKECNKIHHLQYVKRRNGTEEYYYQQNRNYIPDLLITYQDGTQKLVEIKPEYLVPAEKIKPSLKRAELIVNHTESYLKFGQKKQLESYL